MSHTFENQSFITISLTVAPSTGSFSTTLCIRLYLQVLVDSFDLNVKLPASIEWSPKLWSGWSSGLVDKRSQVQMMCCCVEPWASLFTLLLQFTQQYKWIPGFSGGCLCTNILHVLIAVLLNTSQRSWNGIWLNTSASVLSVKYDRLAF